MLCDVYVSKESALIPHVETNDFSHKFAVCGGGGRKNILEFCFDPNRELRLEAGTKLKNVILIIKRKKCYSSVLFYKIKVCVL